MHAAEGEAKARVRHLNGIGIRHEMGLREARNRKDAHRLGDSFQFLQPDLNGGYLCLVHGEVDRFAEVDLVSGRNALNAARDVDWLTEDVALGYPHLA
jgi:hypothetical protein